jgi:hypothetical protein
MEFTNKSLKFKVKDPPKNTLNQLQQAHGA